MMKTTTAVVVGAAMLAALTIPAFARHQNNNLNQFIPPDKQGFGALIVYPHGFEGTWIAHSPRRKTHGARRHAHLEVPQAASPNRGTGSLYLVTIQTAAGPITVNRGIADRMAGFINDAVARGFKGPVACYSPIGHMYNSTHHSGGGCDFAQSRKNATHRVMYRVADLAKKWQLVDGCSFRDCGHIDGGRSYNAPPAYSRGARPTRQAARRHRHRYAGA